MSGERCRFSLERSALRRRSERRVRRREHLGEVLTGNLHRCWPELAKERVRGLTGERAGVDIGERRAAVPEAVELVCELGRARLRLG